MGIYRYGHQCLLLLSGDGMSHCKWIRTRCLHSHSVDVQPLSLYFKRCEFYGWSSLIVLFTDFGWNGPYVGQMKMVLHSRAPAVPVIDLMHDAPRFNAKASGYLLASLVTRFPAGAVFLAVVDPGVGNSGRRPVVVKTENYWLVGPDNGLFDPLIRQSEQVSIYEILWRPQDLSASFHGRDLFAPVAAEIALNKQITCKTAVYSKVIDAQNCPTDLFEIIYIDNFANLQSGITCQSIHRNSILMVQGKPVAYAETFSAVAMGEPFWYCNSQGLVEIAVNQGSAVDYFKAEIGTKLVISN